MRVKINGRPEEVDAETLSVADLLRRKGIQPETVAVELNMEVVSKSEYASRRLRPEDVIEIVRFVGGG